jgi:hypothetical protein
MDLTTDSGAEHFVQSRKSKVRRAKSKVQRARTKAQGFGHNITKLSITGTNALPVSRKSDAVQLEGWLHERSLPERPKM